MGCCYSKNLSKTDPNLKINIKGEVINMIYIGR